MLKLTRSLLFFLAIWVLFLAWPAAAASEAHVVEVIAIHDHESDRHLFRISKHELEAGWTTFRFVNASPVDHFFLIWQYPEPGIAAAEAAGDSLLEHWRANVAGAFAGFDQYLAGRVSLEDYTGQLVASLAENAPWFLDPGAIPTGGPGFTAPGAASTTTVFLAPGDYIVECYVRDEEGVFHTEAGMLDHLIVSADESGASQPSATARVVISYEDGIQVETAPVAGPNLIEIQYASQMVYPHFLGHNVQLVRLQDKDDEQALAEIAQWMDWRHPNGLVNRAPAGARFLGGVMEMSAGATGYLHVDIEPGDYAWIAEVPNPAEHGMLRTFTISAD